MRADRLLAALPAIALIVALLAPSQTFAQVLPPITAPSPLPTTTPQTSPLPYPAYGSPAPDVAAQVVHPSVPVTVSLKQAIAIAVMGSPTFSSQQAQYRAIHAKYTSEKDAILPSISGSVSVSRNYGSIRNTFVSSSPTPPPSSNGMFTTIGGQLQLQQLIFDGGRVIAGIRTAKESDIAGHDTLIRELQTLANTVAQAYYGVLQAQATVTADAQLVSEFQTQENAVTQQIRLGAAARSNLAAAQFQTEQARGQLITAQGAVITAQSTFATTLGLDADTAIAPQALANGARPRVLTYPQAIAQAFALRPDYLAAAHQVEASKENERFAKLARFPSISAIAGTGYNESLPANTPKLIPSQSLGATLTIPIFDQGQTNYNVALAAAQLDEDIAALRLTKLAVESNVRSALASLISAQATLVQTQAELRSAQVNSQATQAEYRVGVSTITALVTAAANLATAEHDNIAALYNERIAEQNYAFALGTSDLSL